ncbi:MAG: ATP-binding protein [Desulfomonilaceae bacterium]
MAQDHWMDRDRGLLEACLRRPSETMRIEFKSWLNVSDGEDQANLAKAILALANYDGGYIILGFTKSENGQLQAQVADSRTLSQYDHDSINRIVKKYADPPFECAVERLFHPEMDQEFPVIMVPGNHTVPIRAARSGPDERHVRQHTYYIRTTVPESAPISSAKEWHDLIRRCVLNDKDDLARMMSRVLYGFGHQESSDELESWFTNGLERFSSKLEEMPEQEKSTKCEMGFWTVAYVIEGDIPQLQPLEFLRTLKDVERSELNGPYWYVEFVGRTPVPKLYNDAIESYANEISDYMGHVFPFEFWRASPKGLLLLLRGYDEDTLSTVRPGSELWENNIYYDVAACAGHAARLARQLAGDSASIKLQFYWEGLKNRRLKTSYEQQTGITTQGDLVCIQPSFKPDPLTVTVSDIQTNLTETVKEITVPLLRFFSFYEPKVTDITKTIEALKNRTPGF